MSITFERESVEFQPIVVTRDGVPVTTGLSTCITQLGMRPVNFTSAVTVGTQVGCMVSGLTVGTYNVWVQISDSPETPVKNAGSFTII
jgi:hypothetical protein